MISFQWNFIRNESYLYVTKEKIDIVKMGNQGFCQEGIDMQSAFFLTMQHTVNMCVTTLVFIVDLTRQFGRFVMQQAFF